MFVKPVRFPTIPAEKLVAPLIIPAAKSDPGILGMLRDGLELPPEEETAGDAKPPELPEPVLPVEGAEKPGL